MSIYTKEFRLGDEVIIKDFDYRFDGKLARVIGVTAKQRNFYSTEYVLAVQGHKDKRERYIKLHVDGNHIERVKKIKAYCYLSDDGQYFWKSSEEPEPSFSDRIPELDFERILKGK